ncbi:hypothetical protein [Rhodobacter sp. NSM]|uniref:hypothetical protein n=1 Tax=Rhodobacter sp. NSM TaxID=3457501 RepID=UPI003FD1082C
MSKQKREKSGKKSGQLVIRVIKAERDAFVSLCDEMDTSAAREIRRFMRGFVAEHSAQSTVAQPDPSSDEATEGAAAENDPTETAAEGSQPDGAPDTSEPAPKAAKPRAGKKKNG